MEKSFLDNTAWRAEAPSYKHVPFTQSLLHLLKSCFKLPLEAHLLFQIQGFPHVWGKIWRSLLVWGIYWRQEGESGRHYSLSRQQQTQSFLSSLGPQGTPQLRCQLQAVSKQSVSTEPATSKHLLRHRAQPLQLHTEPLPSHTNSTRHHNSVWPGALLCYQVPPHIALNCTVHTQGPWRTHPWDVRERHVAKRQHSLARNGLGNQIKLFVSTIWFSKMHVPRKHHSINTCAPNHLPQPLLAENQNVSASNPTGTIGQAPANAVAGSKGLSRNSAFTFIGSLNIPIASGLAGMKEKSFLKNLARMNFHSSWSVFQQVPGSSHW